VLGIYAAVVYTFTTRILLDTLDQQLGGDYQWAAAVAEPQPNGSFLCPLCDELEASPLTIAFDSGAVAGGPWFEVRSPQGGLLYASTEARLRPLARAGELARRPASADGFLSLVTPQGQVRVLTRHLEICPPGTFRPLEAAGGASGSAAAVQCAPEVGGGPAPPPVSVVVNVLRPEAAMRDQLADVLLILLLGLPASVAVAGIGGYTLARRALAPVDAMTERARTITVENLHDRLPVEHPEDEMGRLATVFNDTLARLEASFESMRRFTADVSHQLRTPLTAIQSVGEVGLREPRDGAAYRRIIGSMLEEVDRLASLVGRLLALSRVETDAAGAVSAADVVDLTALASDVAAHLGVLAEEKGQSIGVEGGAGLRAVGDRLLLRQALINLVHNAIKYTPGGGRVRIRLAQSGDRAFIDVEDSGPGIPEAMRPRLFERFYGGDAREHAGDGVGLGLSIARRAVEANRGRLSLESSEPGRTCFRIALPLGVPAARRAS
jgi:heavy metal sensor kinase